MSLVYMSNFRVNLNTTKELSYEEKEKVYVELSKILIDMGYNNSEIERTGMCDKNLNPLKPLLCKDLASK